MFNNNSVASRKTVNNFVEHSLPLPQLQKLLTRARESLLKEQPETKKSSALPRPASFSVHSTANSSFHASFTTGMPTTYQQRLEILYKRTSYADTYRITTNFTTKWIKLTISYTNVDKVLYSNKCCGRDCHIRISNNDFIALYFLPMFAPQAIPKLSKILHTDIVHTLNWDATHNDHLDPKNRQLGTYRKELSHFASLIEQKHKQMSTLESINNLKCKTVRLLINHRYGTTEPLKINSCVLIVTKTPKTKVSKKIQSQKVSYYKIK